MQKNKNCFVELCRFLFCVIIMLHHFPAREDGTGVFPSGYQAVEYFFFLSGFFAMKHICGEKAEIPEKMRYAMGYTVRKLKRIFPYTAIGIVACYAWRAYIVWEHPLEMARVLVNLPYELFFLPMTGVMSLEADRFMNLPLWYLSAMLIVLPIVIYLALKIKDVFCSYMVWLVPWVLHGWLIMQVGGVGNWNAGTIWGISGVIRAFADLTMGCGIYLAAVFLGKREIGKGKKGLLTAVEILLMLGGFVLCIPKPDAYNAELVFFMMAVSLTITMSGQSYTKLLHGAFWLWLGKLSLPVYCLHGAVTQMVNTFGADFPVLFRGILACGGSILVSVLVVVLIETRQLKIKQLKNRWEDPKQLKGS